MGCTDKPHGQREMERHSPGQGLLLGLRLTKSQRSQFSTCLLLTVKRSVIINASLLLPSKLAAAELLMLSNLFLSAWQVAVSGDFL